MEDKQPQHYQNPEGIDVFAVADIFDIKDPRLFSALKYILRCGKKDEEEKEIQKAVHCLELYRAKVKSTNK